MFNRHDYFMITPTNDIVRTVAILGVLVFLFGELMYEKGRRASK